MVGSGRFIKSLRMLFCSSLAAFACFGAATVRAENCVSTGQFSCGEGCAESADGYSSLFEGRLCSQPYLLGDLGGWRDQATSGGYTFSVNSTQFYQGVTSGGISHGFQYSGRNDYLLNVDGQKAGLWEGLFISLHGETRYGDSHTSQTGSLLPANVGTLFPSPKGTVTALTAVKFTQALSEQFLVFAGKINLLDELIQPYAGGRGVDAFMNTGLAFPVAAARTVPYATLGAGFAVLEGQEAILSAMVLDTHNSATTSGFENFFTNGASIIGKLNIPVTVSDLPGHQGIWGTYSSGTYSNLEPTAYFDPEAGLMIATGRQTGSWSLFYAADQALYVDPSNPKRSFGLFTNIGIADNGPSPVRWSANVGLGGSSPISTRPLDTFGIGYSHVEYSTPVQTLAPVLLPIGNDDAVEVFYNIAVTPWFRLTPDLQILMPARDRTFPPGATAIDTAVVFGLRGKIEF